MNFSRRAHVLIDNYGQKINHNVFLYWVKLFSLVWHSNSIDKGSLNGAFFNLQSYFSDVKKEYEEVSEQRYNLILNVKLRLEKDLKEKNYNSWKDIFDCCVESLDNDVFDADTTEKIDDILTELEKLQ